MPTEPERFKISIASEACPSCGHRQSFIGRRLHEDGVGFHIAEFCCQCRALIQPGKWLPKSRFKNPETLPLIQGD
jgi:hypothetical protein